MPEPIALAGKPGVRMSEAEYDAERSRLRDAYGDNPAQAGAKREQALAILFENSHWSQEELAKKEGKSQTHIAKLLRFGRFLNISSMELITETVLSGLNERRFRDYWNKTEKTAGADRADSERDRFEAIIELMKDPPGKRVKLTSGTIAEIFGDGEWHLLKDIAAKVADGDEKNTEATLQALLYPRTQKAKAERRKHGKSFEYRIFTDIGDSVPTSEIRTKLGPILKKLTSEGKKNMATMSPGTVAMLAFEIEKLLKEWTQ